MQVLKYAARAVNAFRGSEVRSVSQQTSLWGLVSLYYRNPSTMIKSNVVSNLANRMISSPFTESELDQIPSELLERVIGAGSKHAGFLLKCLSSKLERVYRASLSVLDQLDEEVRQQTLAGLMHASVFTDEVLLRASWRNILSHRTIRAGNIDRAVELKFDVLDELEQQAFMVCVMDLGRFSIAILSRASWREIFSHPNVRPEYITQTIELQCDGLDASEQQDMLRSALGLGDFSARVISGVNWREIFSHPKVQPEHITQTIELQGDGLESSERTEMLRCALDLGNFSTRVIAGINWREIFSHAKAGLSDIEHTVQIQFDTLYATERVAMMEMLESRFEINNHLLMLESQLYREVTVKNEVSTSSSVVASTPAREVVIYKTTGIEQYPEGSEVVQGYTTTRHTTVYDVQERREFYERMRAVECLDNYLRIFGDKIDGAKRLLISDAIRDIEMYTVVSSQRVEESTEETSPGGIGYEEAFFPTTWP